MTQRDVAAAMRETLTRELAPVHLEVVNESGSHNVPDGSQTHFKVVVVSPEFEGKRMLQRHRRVYGLLQGELDAGVHALALHTFTPGDWPDAPASLTDSPNCRGGKAREGVTPP